MTLHISMFLSPVHLHVNSSTDPQPVYIHKQHFKDCRLSVGFATWVHCSDSLTKVTANTGVIVLLLLDTYMQGEQM